MQAFVLFCQLSALSWTSAAGLDLALVTIFNFLYRNGCNGDEGEKVLAALAHFLPQYSKKGQAFLPRCLRAIRGWNKLAPAQQRLPMPKVTIFAVVGSLLHLCQPMMALSLVLTFFAYLRPSETLALLVRHPVPPQPGLGNLSVFGLLLHDTDVGRPGKTGILDDAVLLDNLQLANPIFNLILLARGANEELFTFKAAELRQEFSEIASSMDLASINPNLYALRHGGASEDLMHNLQSALEVQLRGRWQTARSLKRYGKTSRLMTQLAKIDNAIVQFGEQIEEEFTPRFLAAVRAPRAQQTQPLTPPRVRSRPVKRQPLQ